MAFADIELQVKVKMAQYSDQLYFTALTTLLPFIKFIQISHYIYDINLDVKFH